MIKRLFITFVFGLALNAVASDYEKEKRWADQIIDALFDGEPFYLKTSERDFLGIYTESSTPSSKGAIVLHGIGIHPDWQTVIYPLRVDLTENGLHTLSIQMPVLANDAQPQDYLELYPQVTPRIDAAIKFLQLRDIDEVYLIGHSLGASMGAYYLSTTQADLKGFIAIGLSSGIENSSMDNLAHIAAISVPMLDLYGSEDLENVVEFAQQRHQASSSAANYQQIKVDGADHFFDGEETALVENTLAWLKDQ